MFHIMGHQVTIIAQEMYSTVWFEGAVLIHIELDPGNPGEYPHTTAAGVAQVWMQTMPEAEAVKYLGVFEPRGTDDTKRTIRNSEHSFFMWLNYKGYDPARLQEAKEAETLAVSFEQLFR